MDNQDIELIKKLVPFNSMSTDDLDNALQEAAVTKYNQGKMIFKRDEQDTNVHWLLAGAIDLLDEKFEAKNRKAGDDAARFPLDNNTPHRVTAITTEEAKILSAPRDIARGIAENKAQDSNDFTDQSVDWMSTLLSSPLFEFIPPTNIQTLFSKFEEQKYDAGDVVITQGEPGDYFYVIQTGVVNVERSVGNKTQLQAELKAGDNFGQDALISNVPRNATVAMLTKGILMRLSAPDFESLLMKPVIESINEAEAAEMIAAGNPKTYLLDVRNPKEVGIDKRAGAVNVPLLLLRKNLPKLKPEAVYITVCDGGKRAELAAYILNEKGFTAYVLKQEAS
jgi:signal-transduction protein with cAMP-binding, CBS, and nucleotidyltransferase domain/rhodanese-related sulfurtransferase